MNKCAYCDSLFSGALFKCPNCGASLFQPNTTGPDFSSLLEARRQQSLSAMLDGSASQLHIPTSTLMLGAGLMTILMLRR